MHIIVDISFPIGDISCLGQQGQGVAPIGSVITSYSIHYTKLYEISKKLAEEGLSTYFHTFQRGRELRPDIFVIISNGPADKYLENVKPTLESNPSKYFELLLGESFTSFYPSVRFNDFYYKAESDSIEPVAILSDIGKYNSTDQLKKIEKKTEFIV